MTATSDQTKGTKIIKNGAQFYVIFLEINWTAPFVDYKFKLLEGRAKKVKNWNCCIKEKEIII